MGRFESLAVRTGFSETELEQAAYRGTLADIIGQEHRGHGAPAPDAVHAGYVERFSELQRRKQEFPGIVRRRIEMQRRQQRAYRMWRDYLEAVL